VCVHCGAKIVPQEFHDCPQYGSARRGDNKRKRGHDSKDKNGKPSGEKKASWGKPKKLKSSRPADESSGEDRKPSKQESLVALSAQLMALASQSSSGSKKRKNQTKVLDSGSETDGGSDLSRSGASSYR
jgi:hypothetical protein